MVVPPAEYVGRRRQNGPMTPTIAEAEAAASRHGRGQGRVLTAVGVVLLLGGLCCLGWLAYQYFGSNVVSRHAYEQEKSALRAEWQRPAPADQAGDKAGQGAGAGGGSSPSSAVAVPGDAIALLRIPRFGTNVEVPILEGTDLGVLARGVGHYVGTAEPGQVGNFAIAGHRVTHGQPFARLLDLNPGDQIIVETRSAVYTYVLDTAPRDLTVKDTASWILDPVPDKPGEWPARALITLTTCQDLFHSPDRSIGFGHLQSTRNKT